ncbi:MAG: carbamoyl-phosphate synthase (glutamine-hydrolyzing) large subunit [Treponema sp.]|nr:carbamoyl-phosphate synthase (glutamine-hydrolyzing) large subunit [Treponema sp.]MCL2236690.1 carbamoyl-phosphate synthase (glutamine-hydrolyzing) large subunit [Treponema sp.]
MSDNNKNLPKKVLILGSGGLKIGQAGEFDYSGSQAIKAMREEDIKTILINPNIATIQTSEGMADSTYFLPVTPEYVRKVIEKEKPDAMLLSFGGQTALNCGVALERDGTLAKNNVRVLGTPVKTIEDTEDRKLFVKRLDEIGALTPRSFAVTDTDAALKAAEEIGYPVMARVAFALGGAGSGICKNEADLGKRCAMVFARKNEIDTPPQILVEEWLGGWKEIEFEIVRDSCDNCITVASMENFDPLGIHTGESIVVSPAQTLTDSELGKLRRIGIDVIRHLGIVGECNIQFALDPFSEDYRIIEVNARLSRSSALASKATGYPLAFIAAKIALGHSMLEISNHITHATKSCFEPALDYIVAKVPRWDLTKFKNVDLRIGSEMKSVGEVMSIARTFEEVIQKALRMTGIGAPGLAGDDALCGESFSKPGNIDAKLRDALSRPTDRRIYAIYRAFDEGWSVDKIYKFTKIDKWFLSKIANVWKIEQELKGTEKLSSSLLARAKQLGFSDARIGALVKSCEMEVRKLRKEYRIKPAIKQIDTLAAEYPAKNNYLYMTYGNAASPSGAQIDDVSASNRGVMVLGSGVYRIGSSVEFDWCCVNAVQTVRNLGRLSIMVNCNPETVSTDYDMCDRLYFEELTLERVLDIYESENPDGVIVSMGGQIPNNLATKLFDAGVNIFGTTPSSIDNAEDRNKFSALLDKLNINQPEWKELTDFASAKEFAKKAGYPVLIRPSYVLSGAAMNVAWDDESLQKFLSLAADVSPEHPVVISKFAENAREIEIDAVARKGEILFHAITEHIENAGIHSGDATVVLPAQRLYIETLRKIKQTSEKIAKALDITGPFNIQFLAQRGGISVIECNLRSSRSFPFCSKVSRVNMIDLAVKAMLGEHVEKIPVSALELQCVGVKAAQFSFSRLHGADPVSGVEMASTGEVGCIGSSISDALLKALLSVGYKIPKHQAKVLLSTGPMTDKLDFLDSAKKLVNMGHELFASRGTAKFLADNKLPVTALAWPLEKKEPNIAELIKKRGIDLIINIPKNNTAQELKNDYTVRRMAVDFDIPLFTNIKVAKEFIDALETLHNGAEIEIKSWEEYCF